MPRKNLDATHRLLFSLWFSWTICMLAYAIVFNLAFVVDKHWMALPVLLLSYILLVYSRRTSTNGHPGCVMLLRTTVQVLFYTALIMEICVIVVHFNLLRHIPWFKATNDAIPFITCLILAPVMAIVTMWKLVAGQNSRFCAECRARNGYAPGTSVVSRVFESETRYQMQIVLMMSLGMAAVQWWYYFAFYININFNTPDHFFFNIMPAVIVLLSCVLMWMRYTNMTLMVGPMTEPDSNVGSVVRYLIVHDDSLLLHEDEHHRYDTPATADVDVRTFLSPEDAKKLFVKVSGLEDAKLRYLYSNKAFNMSAEVIHYAAFVDNDSTGVLEGKWTSLDEIDRLMRRSRLSADMCDEVYRIFTVTMAWKTYSREGKRLYPIKHYRPTFRLRDFRDWAVDYEDPVWLDVASNNEDRPFYRTRRLWRRLTGSNT